VTEEARSTAEAVARRSDGTLVAFLAARTQDVTGAEDALSEAFAAALAEWPRKGCPSNPEAWLLTVARRKLIDATRRRRRGETATPQLRLLAEGRSGGPASRSASRSARSCPAGSAPCRTPSTPRSAQAGPTPAGPTWPAARAAAMFRATTSAWPSD